VAVTIVVFAVATVGCGESGANAGSPSSTTVPPRLATTTISVATTMPPNTLGATTVPDTAAPATATTTPSVDDAAQEILAIQNSYRAAMDAITAATTNPMEDQRLALEATLAEGMLTDWSAILDRRRADGIAARPGPQNLLSMMVRSVTVREDSARLESCEVDDRVQYRIADGVVTNDDVSTSIVDAELRQFDGVWKVTGRVPRSVEKGQATCAAQ